MKPHKLRIAIVGKGRLGTVVAGQLQSMGAEPVLLTREMGFDITQPVSFEPYGPFHAVVEATDIFTNQRSVGGHSL